MILFLIGFAGGFVVTILSLMVWQFHGQAYNQSIQDELDRERKHGK
jgi:hypothetical protein